MVDGVIMVSQPPMTPARPRGFGVVGDDEVFGIEDALDAVEGLELFAFAGAADDDAAFDLVEVEGVGGLAHGEPGEVGGVDGVGDFLLLEQGEVGGDFGAGEPVARFADGDAAQNAGGEAAAGVFGFDAARRRAWRPACASGRANSSGWQREAVDGRGLARDAVVVHGIDAVGGDVHLVERAVACAEIVDAFDGDAAQGEVFSELGVVDREFGQDNFGAIL